MVDFAKLLADKRREGQKYSYLYRCTGCGKDSWRWFELPEGMTQRCSIPELFGKTVCKGPMELVAMRKAKR